MKQMLFLLNVIMVIPSLQFFGVDPLQAGNVVQLVLVLGLTVGWISTYIFRVSNKEMTYVQQLRDYESKVMEVCHLALALRNSSTFSLLVNIGYQFVGPIYHSIFNSWWKPFLDMASC